MAELITIPIDAVVYHIELDLYRKTDNDTVKAVQYDKGKRYIVASIWNKGVFYPINAECSINFAATKPSGLAVYDSAGIDSEGRIVYLIEDQVTAEHGIFQGEFEIVANNGHIRPFLFNIFVEKSALQNDAIISTPQVNILDDLIKDANDVIEDMNETLTIAEDIINNANTTIDNLNQLNQEVSENETIRNSNESNRINAETNRVNIFENIKSESEIIITNAYNVTNRAEEMANYAEEKAELAALSTTNANDSADNAKVKSEYAENMGNYAKEKANLVDIAAANANEASDNANLKANYAKEMGDLAHEQTEIAKTTIVAANGIIEHAESIISDMEELNQDVADAENIRNTNEENRQLKELERENLESLRQIKETERQAFYESYRTLETYSDDAQYLVNNKVTYQGGTYQCIENSMGNPPQYNNDNTYWKCIAARGSDGNGTGDMAKEIYDPQERKTDIFKYIDDKTYELPDNLLLYSPDTVEIDTPTKRDSDLLDGKPREYYERLVHDVENKLENKLSNDGDSKNNIVTFDNIENEENLSSGLKHGKLWAITKKNFDTIDIELKEALEKAEQAKNATTVNGHTVESDVPTNAKFTDTIYTHPSTHPPTILSNGSLPTGVVAAEGTDYGTKRLRNIYAGTADMTAGSSSLANGAFYVVYE